MQQFYLFPLIPPRGTASANFTLLFVSVRFFFFFFFSVLSASGQEAAEGNQAKRWIRKHKTVHFVHPKTMKLSWDRPSAHEKRRHARWFLFSG